MAVEKQKTGFKFGKYRLMVLRTIGEIPHNGRVYRLVEVQTHDQLRYLSLRLYNAKGKFIKQLLIEPELAEPVSNLFREAVLNAKH